MSITSNRYVNISFEDDIVFDQSFNAVVNTVSPGSITVHTLTSGSNTISLPTGGVTVKSATIIPPATNTLSLTLKGISADTGISISKVDPTSLAFETAPSTFVITAGGNIPGLRIIWS
jgi:hypothetical protein